VRDKLIGNLEDWWRLNRRTLAPAKVRILLATATARSTAALTTNVTSYAGTAFTPAANELCVAFVTVTASRIDSGNGRAALSDTQNLGWVLVDFALKATSADSCYVFVASKLAANSATTPTFDCTGDAGTGATIQVFGISGMTRTGIDAVRQTAKQSNGAAAATPAPVFASACLTGNVVAGIVNNAGTAGSVETPPAGWTEGDDTGYITPSTGAEYAFINSGFTGTTVTWGAASATAFCALVIEFDTTTATSSTPYVALTGAVASGTATLTVVPPTGIANNDICVLIVEQSDTAAITGMATYSQQWQFTNSTVIRQTGMWKRSNGTESNVSVTYSGGATISAYIIVWRGCATTGNPFDGTPVSQNGTATTVITAPSYTPTNSPTGIGFAAHGGINNTSGGPAIQVWSGTYPTFIETVENIGNLGASTVSIGHAWGGAKATTALGARTVNDIGEAATPNTLGTIYALKGEPVAGATTTKIPSFISAAMGRW
jgi:hypothetical protein